MNNAEYRGPDGTDTGAVDDARIAISSITSDLVTERAFEYVSTGGDPSDVDTITVMTIPNNRVAAHIDVRIRREKIFAWLSYGFAIIFALTLLSAGIAAIVGGDAWKNTKELLPLVLPVETVLLGGLVGFYFASQQSSVATQSSTLRLRRRR